MLERLAAFYCRSMGDTVRILIRNKAEELGVVDKKEVALDNRDKPE